MTSLRATTTLDDVPTDEELVEAARHALPAFEHLYRRYVSGVYGYCFRRLGSEADAADATSLTFTRALANIQSCDPRSFRPWLFTIVRHVVLDHFRTKARLADLTGLETMEDPRAGPEEQAVAGDTRRLLQEGIRRLSEEQRSIIELRLAGLNTVEIATVLGKSRNAIDQAQFRAVNRLRALIRPSLAMMEEPAT
jgi:RNA polymerase sigma-70 factor (ECF subfamily)